MVHARWLVGAVALAGCEVPVGGETGGDVEDTAAMVWSTETPSPELDLDAISAILSGVVTAGAPNGQDIASTWLEHLSHGEGSCPGGTEFMDRPASGCTTSAGWYYEGIGWYEVTAAEEGPDGEMVELGLYNGGDFVILSPEGHRFAGGGELRLDTTDEGETRSTALNMAGSWIDEDRPDWLGLGFSAVYEGTLTSGPQGMAITLTGGLGVGDADLFLNGLSYDQAGDCPGVLRGAISVRDSRGYWSTWDLGQDCDTCGDVTFHEDQPVGELCLDLSAWGSLLLSANAPR